ncbi:MAG: GDSL-type esterase/lipase family protein [Muribaculum sp.]|nr:GDSL-type esterase/lipase family protein [Muribaculum sp.]
MTEAEASAVSLVQYFGSWTPAFYREEAEEIAFTTPPFVTDNGDLNTPYPGHKLTVGYSLGAANDANDASLIQWYRVKDGTETLVKLSNATIDKTYKITADDVGCYIKVTVTPTTVSGRTGTAASHTVEAVVGEGYEDPDAAGGDAVLGDGVNIFLAGDSTVKDYSAKGINSGGTARNEGAWGEFLQSYFNSDKVTVVNYANGGRSTRNFINEGSLDKIAEKIGKGDYLFIQFGHNDCSNGASYLADRYVPLGTPDANGVYPSTPGVKQTTPPELAGNKYGETCYTYDCGGTFKWYLQQYIDVAKNAGATPVLVTPVSRMYYNSDGSIRPHHDSTDENTNTQVTSNNAYVTAVKQLAKEQNVLLVDGFELTKTLFEDAYKAGGSDVYGTQIMYTGDKTHNNKLGGMIEAAAIASAIQNMGLDISYAVKAPGQVLGETTDGSMVFMVSGNGKFTAYDINSGYKEKAAYWESLGQKMFDDIAEKAQELGGSKNPGGTQQTIQPVTGEGLEIVLADPNASYPYTGAAIKPALAVFNNGELLAEGTDYTVKYSNNVKAAQRTDKKAPTITVTGKGRFTGKTVQTFDIEKKELSLNDPEIEFGGLDESGALVVADNAKASPVILYNGMKLGAKDYTLSNTGRFTEATSDKKLTITGKGNYSGEVELNVAVVAKSQLKKISVTINSKVKLTYNGAVQDAVEAGVITVKAGGEDITANTGAYTVVYGGDRKSAGTQKITVIGQGMYTGSVSKSYKISPLAEKDAGKFEITGVESSYSYKSAGVTLDDLEVTYNGEDLTETLQAGRDYKVTYSNHKKVSTAKSSAKYTITFLGNYKGSAAIKNQTFTVLAADLAAMESDGSLSVKSADKAYTKKGQYKSAPYVLVDGVLLKSSEYSVKYYLDPATAESRTEMKGKIELGEGEDSKTVYVAVTGKKNYTGTVETQYEVKKHEAGKTTDISKATITLKDQDGNKQSKMEYTGEAVYPGQIAIKVNKDTAEVVLTPDASGSWDNDNFAVEFVNNIEKGKATVIITGKGDYVGSKTATFNVVAQKIKSDIWSNLAKMLGL